jgi:hypothetical protein
VKESKYHPAAAEEAVAAAAWYASEQPQLGEDFAHELGAAVALLRKDPIPCVPYQHVSGRVNAKRILFQRFPYDLVFVERGNTIFIVAIAHQARRPGYWKARLRI